MEAQASASIVKCVISLPSFYMYEIKTIATDIQ